jgi:uncharacterized protein YjeT (DUF2065 family)
MRAQTHTALQAILMNQRGIEIFAALYFLAIGLSHLLQPQAWVDFFVRLRNQGRSGMFTEGFLAMTFGALVVSFHNVWTGLPMVLTLLGWAQVAKGLTRFVAPQLSLRTYQRVTPERAWQFRIGGVFALGIAAFLGYLLIR